MYTRLQYIRNECTHEEYYGQFVNEAVKELVIRRIGKDRIEESQDKYFNDISLRKFDVLCGRIVHYTRTQWEKIGETNITLSDTVCIAKEACRQIRGY